MIVQIAVIGAAALIGLGVVSIKSMAQGKQDFKRIAIMAVPFVAFGVSYLVLENIVEAAVMSAAFMMASMALAILLSGLRGTFKF